MGGTLASTRPSRFLMEIQPEWEHADGILPEEDVSRDLDELAPGTPVAHKLFGVGRVLYIRGSGDNARATVDFATAGKKTLVLGYAGLKRVR